MKTKPIINIMMGLVQKILMLMFLQVIQINAQGCPENPGSIVDVALGAAPEFSILVDLVTRADLGGYLADLSKESTVFGE
jgi:hypothetical protein